MQVCTTDATSAPEAQPIYVTVSDKSTEAPQPVGGAAHVCLHAAVSERHVSAYVDVDPL